MLSKTCEYAIRAMIFIAQQGSSDDKLGIKAIASGIDAPAHFIAKILQELSRKGLVQSAKGPSGGFYLDKQSRAISLADIVKAIDGDKIFTKCGLGLKNCSEKKPCPLHYQFKPFREQFYQMLKDSSIVDFSEQLHSGTRFLKRS